MDKWKEALKPAGVVFMQEIIDQIPEEHGARHAFTCMLEALTEHQPKEVEEKLAKLQALENGGVDNWDGYDFAMEELADEDEDEDEGDEDD
jgi:hypothetical protein